MFASWGRRGCCFLSDDFLMLFWDENVLAANTFYQANGICSWNQWVDIFTLQYTLKLISFPLYFCVSAVEYVRCVLVLIFAIAYFRLSSFSCILFGVWGLCCFCMVLRVVNNIFYLSYYAHLSYPTEMSNQELVNAGMKTMDETDQAIERSKQVSHIKLMPPLCPHHWSYYPCQNVGCTSNNWSWHPNCFYLEGPSKFDLNWVCYKKGRV